MTRFENAKNTLKEEMEHIIKDVKISLNLKTEDIMKCISTEDIAVLACVENFEMADDAILRFIKKTRGVDYADAYIEIMRMAYIAAADMIAVANLNNKE